jgi:GNAT superfamily N-acetyltransferase
MAGDDSAIGEVGRLVVSPAHRRRGVADMLMNTAISHAQANGLRVLRLFTTDFHDVATKMYMKKGWVVETKIAYPGYSDWWRFVIVFRKDLV